MSAQHDRGGWWVVGQFALLGLALVAPRRGPSWPRALTWPARVLGVAAIGGGVFLTRRAFSDLGASLSPFPKPKPDAELVREGIYAQVRHPIYGGLILVALGWATLTTNTTRLALAGALTAWLSAKARREEVWLLEQFPDYAAYREEVPGLLPSPW